MLRLRVGLERHAARSRDAAGRATQPLSLRLPHLAPEPFWSDGGGDPWIWDAVNGVRSLTSILQAANGDVSQWSRLGATAMSADGKTVVGVGGLASVSGLTSFIARLP